MSLQQILSLPTPLLRGSTPIYKKLQNLTVLIKSAALKLQKTARRTYKTTARKHYFMPTAFADVKKAARQNEDIVVASVVWTLMLVYACTVLAAQFILSISKATYAMSETKGLNIGIMLLAVSVSVLLFCALVSATSMGFMSLALMDGANRKVYRSIRSTLGRSLKTASRITSAWLLQGMLHCVRFIVVMIPIIIYAKWLSAAVPQTNKVLIVLAIIGAIWLLAGMLRYALVPYIVLFEPQHLVTESFGRSKQLVNRQAVVFMLSESLVFGVYVIGMYQLCTVLKQWLGISSNLLFILSVMVGVMLANGAMVMLYRKRKLARN